MKEALAAAQNAERAARRLSRWAIAGALLLAANFVVLVASASRRSSATPLLTAPPAPVASAVRDPLALSAPSARPCLRCGRALSNGALSIYDVSGRETFSGCGACLCELLEYSRRNLGVRLVPQEGR